MTKGFMLFVEGGNPPKKVHRQRGTGYRELYRLSDAAPDKEVVLFQVVKRVKNGKSIGSHFPKTDKNMVDIGELVPHDELLEITEKDDAKKT